MNDFVTTFAPKLADELEFKGDRSIYIYRRDDYSRELKLLRLADDEN